MDTFGQVFDELSQRYKGLEMRGTLVYYNGEVAFNTDGYNLLYNLKRLCNLLDAELL